MNKQKIIFNLSNKDSFDILRFPPLMIQQSIAHRTNDKGMIYACVCVGCIQRTKLSLLRGLGEVIRRQP